MRRCKDYLCIKEESHLRLCLLKMKTNSEQFRLIITKMYITVYFGAPGSDIITETALEMYKSMSLHRVSE